MNNLKNLSISDLRQHTAQAVRDVIVSQTPSVIYQRSQPKAVLVDFNYYQALEEAVLDVTDNQEAEKAKKEPKDAFSSYLKKRWDKTSL